MNYYSLDDITDYIYDNRPIASLKKAYGIKITGTMTMDSEIVWSYNADKLRKYSDDIIKTYLTTFIYYGEIPYNGYNKYNKVYDLRGNDFDETYKNWLNYIHGLGFNEFYDGDNSADYSMESVFEVNNISDIEEYADCFDMLGYEPTMDSLDKIEEIETYIVDNGQAFIYEFVNEYSGRF